MKTIADLSNRGQPFYMSRARKTRAEKCKTVFSIHIWYIEANCILRFECPWKNDVGENTSYSLTMHISSANAM